MHFWLTFKLYNFRGRKQMIQRTLLVFLFLVVILASLWLEFHGIFRKWIVLKITQDSNKRNSSIHFFLSRKLALNKEELTLTSNLGCSVLFPVLRVQFDFTSQEAFFWFQITNICELVSCSVESESGLSYLTKCTSGCQINRLPLV